MNWNFHLPVELVFGSGTRHEIKSYIEKIGGTRGVLVGGKPARASYDVKVGDILEISFGARLFKAEVTSVAETVRKDDAAGLYRVME